jgi:hypothetical protein
LLDYAYDLETPPLLVYCDLDRFETHTNFTNTRNKAYGFTLADLANGAATPARGLPPLEVLRAAFNDPEKLRPERVAERVTKEAADQFTSIASNLKARGHNPVIAARLLMRLLFCLFAEDITLLPTGLFTTLVQNTRTRPEESHKRVRLLFNTMSTGGSFCVEDVKHFNGGEFNDDSALELTSEDLVILAGAGSLDWTSVEPAMFGTLFQRSLDPAK